MKSSKMAKKATSLILTLSLVVCAIVVLSGCDLVRQKDVQTNTTPTVSDTSLIEAGTLTVGVNAQNTPYGGKNSSGNMVGYDVDYAAALASSMGLKAKIVDIGEAGKQALVSKQADVVLGLQRETIKNNPVVYTNAYLNDGIALFCKSDKAPANISQVKLGSVKILAQAGTTPAYTLQKALGVSTVVVTSTLEEAFEALQSGTADYLACNAVAGAYYARNYENISFINYMSSANIVPIYGAVLGANTELINAVNIAVQTVASNGVQTTLASKWLGSTGTTLLPGGTDTSSLPKKIQKAGAKDSKSKKSKSSKK